MKELYKLGFARRGALNNYWNRESFPPGLSPEELRLSEMVPEDGERSIVFKPLPEGWYLLAGIHRGTGDRGAAVVAARLFNAPVAEELLSEPEQLLRLGLFLRDGESAETVERYSTAQPEHAVSPSRLPPLGPEWDSAAAPPEQVRLVLCGMLSAGEHEQLRFLDAGPAALRAALERVPVALSRNCGFSLPFNKTARCCTDLNLLPCGGAARMLDERGEGWPNKARSALSREPGELRLALDALMSMSSHQQWQSVYGAKDRRETLALLSALGAVRAAEQAGQPRAAAADHLAETFRWRKRDAERRVRELDRLLGPEPETPRTAARRSSNAQPMVCPCAQELKWLLRSQKRAERDRRYRFLLAAGLFAVGLVLLLLTPLGTGERALTLHLHLALNAKSVLALGLSLALGVCLGRISAPPRRDEETENE